VPQLSTRSRPVNSSSTATVVHAHLRSDLARLLISLRLLLRTYNFASFRITCDWSCAFTFACGLVRLLECGFHIPRERQLSDQRHKALSAKDGAEDFFGVDKATFRCALFGPKLVVFVSELGIGERLVGDGNGLEELFGIRVVAVLVRVVFDCESACTRPLVSKPPTSNGWGIARHTICLLNIVCRCINWYSK
jgi:hypothetical protein